MGDVLYIKAAYVEARKRIESDDRWEKDIQGYVIENAGFGIESLFIPIKDATNELLNAIISYSPNSFVSVLTETMYPVL